MTVMGTGYRGYQLYPGNVSSSVGAVFWVHETRCARDRVTRKGKEHIGKVFTGEVMLGPGLMSGWQASWEESVTVDIPTVEDENPLM